MEPIQATHSESFSFFIPGIAAPGGSKRGFALKKNGVYTGRVIITDDAGQRNKDWKSNVGWTGREAMLRLNLHPFSGALEVTFDFIMPRLKSHFRITKKDGTQLRSDAPEFHTVKPDTTKLIRSTEDGLKAICWPDDSQIAVQHGSKRYGVQPGCTVTISQIAPSL